ncbi:MAG: hypothetical protein EOP85_16045 [Verrucomicrobiaceae bacterium]|nr:MAG: hypothetical protein EOP85_16045 [Verrucomicrobiaceae bacterium]
MKAIFLLLTATLLSVHAQGPLLPAGPPAPGMKSLDQIAPGKPITSLPYFINEPGAYYLTGNLVHTAVGVALGVNASGVTVDLRGFTISCTSTANDDCIYVYSDHDNVRVFNGSIAGNTTVSMSGAVSNRTWNVYTAGGFSNGINSSFATSCQFSDLVITGCINRGIILGPQCVARSVIFRSNGNCATSVTGRGASVIDCIASLNGNQGGFNGFVAGDNEATFVNCIAISNGSIGIRGVFSAVNGCLSSDNGSIGILANSGTATQCLVKDNEFPGITADNGVISFSRGEGNDIGHGSGDFSGTGGVRVNNYPAP